MPYSNLYDSKQTAIDIFKEQAQLTKDGLRYNIAYSDDIESFIFDWVSEYVNENYPPEIEKENFINDCVYLVSKHYDSMVEWFEEMISPKRELFLRCSKELKQYEIQKAINSTVERYKSV